MDNGQVRTGNGKYKGTYECEGTAIKVKIAGQEFVLGGGAASEGGGSEGGGGSDEGGGGGGGTSSYHTCPDTFPIAMYCKNSTIRKVQVCLGIRADGAFGPQTKSALEGKGLPGDEITQDSVDKACGGGSSTTSSGGNKPPISDVSAED